MAVSGLILAARSAGYKPDSRPITVAKPTANRANHSGT